MILHVKKARYLRGYAIWVRFNDGAEGEVDLADELECEVFEPLQNLSLFKALRADPILETVVWPNGADFAPEFLYDKMKVADYEVKRSAWKRLAATVCEPRGAYRAARTTRPKKRSR